MPPDSESTVRFSQKKLIDERITAAIFHGVGEADNDIADRLRTRANQPDLPVPAISEQFSQGMCSAGTFKRYAF